MDRRCSTAYNVISFFRSLTQKSTRQSPTRCFRNFLSVFGRLDNGTPGTVSWSVNTSIFSIIRFATDGSILPISFSNVGVTTIWNIAFIMWNIFFSLVQQTMLRFLPHVLCALESFSLERIYPWTTGSLPKQILLRTMQKKHHAYAQAHV